VDPDKYGNLLRGLKVTVRENGVRGLGLGWAPTLVGYSMQGLFKFGCYEIFKSLYSRLLGEERSYTWRTSLYLAASASAEFFADIALAPMEAVKVRIQTQPGWETTLRTGVPRIWKEEGFAGFYKGVVPLWGRQIPYTMMKFACFERTVEALYRYVVPKKRDDCSKPEQLVVTFAAGYIGQYNSFCLSKCLSSVVRLSTCLSVCCLSMYVSSIYMYLFHLAGVFCALVSHPADSIVSKLNSDVGSTMFQAAKNLGWKGMWKGLGPRILMIGTLTALQWFIYDFVKVSFRLPRPPPPEMPESLKKKLVLQPQTQ
jgi:solute carrier family 25 phosphate transporter 3